MKTAIIILVVLSLVVGVTSLGFVFFDIFRKDKNK